MTSATDTRRAEVTSVEIKDGAVVVIAEDVDAPQRTYGPIPVATPLASQTAIPPVGSKVVVSAFHDGSKYVSGILTTPGGGSDSEASIKQGALNGTDSLVLTFVTEEKSEPETFEIAYSDNGFQISADVDGDITLDSSGDITLSAGGDVRLDEGGSTKALATEDHTHSCPTGGMTGEPDDTTSVEVE